MTADTFAPWLQPIANETLGGAEELLVFVRAQPDAFWSRPSALEGWTCRDVLAHLAGDTGKVTATAMRAAVTGGPFEDPPDFKDGGDALNARDVTDRRDWTIAALIEEMANDRREWAGLMAQLKDADDGARWEGFPLTLGQYLRVCAGHDREHLEHLRVAPEAQR